MSSPRARRGKALAWLADHGYDALILRSPANTRYLTGFAGEGVAVICPEACAVSTDSRYALDAKEQARGCKIILSGGGHLAGAVEFLRKQAAKTVAFEAESMVYAEYETLKKQLKSVKFRGIRRDIAALRRVKDKGEIAAIRRAAAITDAVMTPLLAAPPVGMSERELALLIETEMVKAGAEERAFPTIAAAGLSAAKPHATPGPTRLAEGMMLTVDCGARVAGYCSDMTRTVFLGDPTDQYRDIYGAVYEAQQAAVAAVRPGVKASDLDRIARGILQERGYADKFGHGLGHGVGLEVHEQPSLGGRSEDVLEKGMVVTIEPGVYIEGWGGVRIEDSVVVKARGCEVLTLTPKEVV
jgi:Xaa-Pro aminopeptidase